MEHRPATDTSETERRRRGRPVSVPTDERREKIFEAAESVFLEVGFAAANMDDIARRAGMSKRTVYELFGNKQTLFDELLDLSRVGLPTSLDDTDAPDEELVDYLTKLTQHIMSPKQIAIQRVVFAEHMRDPERSQNLFSEAEKRGRGILSRWVARQVEEGRLAVTDPGQAADMLFGMTVGAIHFRKLLLGRDEALSSDKLRQRIAQAVAIFLKGAGP